MTNEVIRVLLLEDNPGDARLVKEMLREAGGERFEVEHADRVSLALARLKEAKYDIVLIDLSLPDSHGLETFETISQQVPHLPVVILSSLDDERMELEAVRRGAQDYLVKGHLDATIITRVLRYAIERKETELMKKEFISIVNHELRTPFTSAYLALQLLHEQYLAKLDPTGQRLLNVAHDNCRLLLRLINNTLDLEKMDAGRMDFDLHPLDLVALVREALQVNQVYAEHHEVTLQLETKLTQVMVAADSDRLQQVLTNLISNAVKYSPPGEAVLLSITRAEGVCRVAVTDKGPGIPAENQARVFEKFSQLSHDHNPRHKGTGLGLVICKHIVEKMGGKIGFKSKPDAATTFWFELAENVADIKTK
jgi:signal transduction histidine kinase